MADGVDGRLASGVDGLDSLLNGGVPLDNQVVIAGGPGAGKTLLCFEILYHNAKKGTPCAFIALEEETDTVIRNFKKAFPQFSDVDELAKKNMLLIDGQDVAPKMESGSSDSVSYSFVNVIEAIENTIKSNGAKCVAIDSLSVMKLMFDEAPIYRKALLGLMSTLRRLKVTSLLTLELENAERKGTTFGAEFFIFDGVVVMHQAVEEDKRVFSMEVLKMRGTAHSLTFSPYEITNRGFKVFSISTEV